MKRHCSVYLSINSNIPRYRLTIKSKQCSISRVINQKKYCLLLFIDTDTFYVILTPQMKGYTTIKYIKVVVPESRIVNIDTNFIYRKISPIRVHQYYLLDRNYGLKLNGTLYFTRRDI